MKTKIALAIVFVAGAAIGAAFSPWRYEIVASGPAFCYRLDRLTGDVDFSNGSTWRRIETKAAAATNQFGDPVAKP